MNMGDVALVAYRLLGLWLAVSGLQALAETLLNWRSLGRNLAALRCATRARVLRVRSHAAGHTRVR
jgi:hypothetical protein